MVFREALVSFGLFASTGCYHRLWRSCCRLQLKSPAAARAGEGLWPLVAPEGAAPCCWGAGRWQLLGPAQLLGTTQPSAGQKARVLGPGPEQLLAFEGAVLVYCTS